VLCVPVSLNIMVVFLLNLELKTVKTEVKNGMYSPWAYIMSNTVVQVPFMFALTLCAITPAFLINGWSFDNFVTFLISYAACYWAWECTPPPFERRALPQQIRAAAETRV
jgi:hypothetical protein